MSALSKIFTFLLCGFVAAVVLAVFSAKPILNDVMNLHNLVKAQKTELATLQNQIRAFKTAQSDMSKAIRKDEIKNAISSRETLVDAVKDLENAVARAGAEHDLQINDGKDARQAKPIPVTLSRDGIEEVAYRLDATDDYLGILTLLSYLEHLPHFTEISKITLSAEAKEGSNGAAAVYTGRVVGSFNGVFFVKSQ